MTARKKLNEADRPRIHPDLHPDADPRTQWADPRPPWHGLERLWRGVVASAEAEGRSDARFLMGRVA